MKNDKIKSTDYVPGMPDTAEQTVNKYGTYNVQDTSDTENKFPEIAQGLPRKKSLRTKKDSK